MNDDQRPRRRSFIISVFGWVTGALSLLNLLRDLASVELYGELSRWVDAYGRLVGRLGDILFGWLKWKWIEVDGREYHVIVLSLLVAGAIARATYKLDITLKKKPTIPGSLLAGFGLASFVPIVLCVILPGWWGIIPSIAAVLIVTLSFAMADAEGDDKLFLTSEDFRRELIAMIAGLIILIVLNYLFFKN